MAVHIICLAFRRMCGVAYFLTAKPFPYAVYNEPDVLTVVIPELITESGVQVGQDKSAIPKLVRTSKIGARYSGYLAARHGSDQACRRSGGDCLCVCLTSYYTWAKMATEGSNDRFCSIFLRPS